LDVGSSGSKDAASSSSREREKEGDRRDRDRGDKDKATDTHQLQSGHPPAYWRALIALVRERGSPAVVAERIRGKPGREMLVRVEGEVVGRSSKGKERAREGDTEDDEKEEGGKEGGDGKEEGEGEKEKEKEEGEEKEKLVNGVVESQGQGAGTEGKGEGDGEGEDTVCEEEVVVCDPRKAPGFRRPTSLRPTRTEFAVVAYEVRVASSFFLSCFISSFISVHPLSFVFHLSPFIFHLSFILKFSPPYNNHI
jgi:hypothetical protein